jgi:DNA-binding transcriptional LysR family regulator
MSTTKPWDDRIGRRLRLRDLHILMSVARCGGMGKAAAELAVSQPAISKAIADIEHTLGVRLLDRTTQGVEPTLYGRALLRWGATVFDDLRQGVKEIEFLADPTAGEVRIGSSEVNTAGLLPAVLDRLSRKYPRLAFTVVQAQNVELQYRELRDRNIDLTLGRLGAPATDEDLNSEILFEDPLCVVAGVNSKYLRRRVAAADLVGETWCLPQGVFVRSRIAEAFRAKGLDLPRHVVLSNSIQLLIALLATGRFLGVLSGSLLQLSGRRLGFKAVPVDLPIEPSPVGIVTLKNRTLNPVAQLVIDCAREVARPIAKGLGRTRRTISS